MGVAHHASYLPWLEMARTELLRARGGSYKKMEEDGIFLVVTKLEVKYRRPIRYDDLIEVRCRLTDGGGVKLRHAYELVLIERDDASPDPSDPATPGDGICSVATTELACVGRDGRPQRLPDSLLG